ncbi:T9SS type A sorting domain-containing protein [Hymenobacter sp. BT770]|uniref:T9SS type A sorting domain-containing protein n=1 Tax=Hymenobacter sp. BT770 TaxID=2886942 RepID=UPI001D121916|nr:T9SS type A sorting domain-containing protein [Hymenobacter sp. BT770]MCC3154357.1 T9SS type A sorting domain-containing protein [Hymenobacter sp. BT770]MDO3415678.1 T9SS type A sorting domain-containing protein [Hymenobacter sp. BT770]
MPFAVPFLRFIGRRSWVVALGLAFAQPVLGQALVPETQCLMLPMEPAVRAQQAALVVEAEVLDAQSFWDTDHRRLFTRHRLRVFSLLKGQVADTTGLVLITEGGRLGLDQQVLTNTLSLTAGQQGVFFLTRAPWTGLPTTVGRAWTPYGSEQGFIAYNLAGRTATEPFRTYPALDATFYKGITQLTGQGRRVLQPNPALVAPLPALQRGTLAPVVANFGPQIIPAGAGALLTINGTGFGSTRGSGFVEFRNADDGGTTRVKARDKDYVSWTDTRIEVRVPSSAIGGSPAGSGTVRVTTSDQQTVDSGGTLTIVYALTNVESTTGLIARPNHIAQNASGGVTFHFGPNFASNAAAAAAWQRALATWRCQTGINWEVGTPATANTIADDNQNVVAFDAGAELPALVLGRTTSYYSGCQAPGGEVVFWVDEVDMQFDDGANFQFGPTFAIGALNQIDFETVAVHELGHAHQLGHLILPGAVMHYSIARGQNTRTLSTSSDIAGGRQVLRVRSFKSLGCSNQPMLPAPLTSFSAKYEKATGVTLTWTTRDECFLNNFVVERSVGSDTTTWKRLGVVATRPGGQYQFFDAQVPGGLLYYRLRLTRPDGSLDNVAPALLSTEGTSAAVVVFPNPATEDQLQVQYPATLEGTVVFRFYDSVGRRIRTTSIATVAGLNILPLNIAGLRPGFYVLRWRDAQGNTGSRKFVRQ